MRKFVNYRLSMPHENPVNNYNLSMFMSDEIRWNITLSLHTTIILSCDQR